MSAQIAMDADKRLLDQLQSPDEPSYEPSETAANEDLLAEEDELESTSYREPSFIHVPRPVVWGFLILFGLTVIAAGMWGFARSTLTYGMIPVDSATSARLAQIHAELAAAGAPEAALRRLAVAAQPGVNIGNAIEALADTDKALEQAGESAAITSARTELRIILDALRSRMYGGQGYFDSHPIRMTPPPTLPISTP
jgi:hypothetical protein